MREVELHEGHASLIHRTESAEEFVWRFADFWADPSAEKMSSILASDVVLIQPLSAPMHGLDAAQAEFRKLFFWFKDLRGTVDGWSVRGPALFIEFRLSATLGGRRVEWSAVDRFIMREGKATERVSYFDTLPLILQVLKTPSAWLGWWRSGAARPWA